MIGENLQLIEKKMAKAVDGEIQVQVPQVVDGMHPLLVELIMEAVHRKVIIEDSNLISSTSIVRHNQRIITFQAVELTYQI